MDNWKGKTALVMGLGLHGGGLASARYLAEAGAEVICTDLRSESVLKPSIRALEGLDIRFVLGEHRREDFDSADIIVKNPAVPGDSPWIAGRNNIETDISLFLRRCPSPILAVTGSKGKSTTVSALHAFLKRKYPNARLGGNITISPLSFVEKLTPAHPVVLELSSWQLADLRGRGVLKPHTAAITNLMHDHQNRYAAFSDYEADKVVILEGLEERSAAFFPDDDFGERWSRLHSGTTMPVRSTPPENTGFRGAWLERDGRGILNTGSGPECVLPSTLKVPGMPFRLNLLFAAGMAANFGMGAAEIHQAAREFSGVPYRMEMFLESGGIQCYDDTAATIPDASAAAVKAMDRPVILIAGGTDKELDYAPFERITGIPKQIVLLPGTATDMLIPLLKKNGASYAGPFDSMEDAVAAASKTARPGDAVLLSPGAASFGLFTHEFERGDAFKNACRMVFNGESGSMNRTR